MALSFLAGSGSSSCVKYFDIRLEEDYVVFRGNEQEAASAHLRGTLVFCVTEPLTIKHVRLTLSGLSRISWNISSTVAVGSPRKALKEASFFENVWTFRDAGKGKTEILQPDNYEYPFDIILDGGLPESIEGLPDSWIIYRFKADIGRKYTKDLHVKRPLRLIRTLGPSALETAHEMSVENIWPNKIEYVIGTPHKAIVLGTSVQVNFRLVSLLKGLRIGLVATEVLETREFTIETEGSSSRKSWKDTKSIVRDTYTVDEGGDPEIIDEEAEGYRFSRYLELPKTLKTCLQDVDIYGIKIRHKLKFNIALHNPDGHISELRATLPICLYISPALPINDENDLVDQSPVASRQALAHDMMNAAPPLYGQHELDHLYSEVDPSGYGSPGYFSTPGTPFGSHSRNISAEDLASLEAISGGGITNGTVTPGGSHVSALALQYRLQNLRVSGSGGFSSPLATEDHNSDHDSEGVAARRLSATPSYSASNDYFSHRPNSSSRPASHRNPTDLSPDYGNAVNGQAPSPHQNNVDSRSSSVPNGDSSGPSSAELSRNPSAEYQLGNYTYSGTRTALPYFHHTEDLARIPSYGMALRTPARTTYSGTDLPSYGAAMSASTAPVVHLRGSQTARGY